MKLEHFLYLEFKSKIKPGDKILTQVNTHPLQREVEVLEGDIVRLEGYTYRWNSFFEVNHPISILKPNDDKNY